MLKIIGALISAIILTGCIARAPATQGKFIPPIFQTHPEIIVIETLPDVYYVKSYVNIFFYNNGWYYYSDNRWYNSSSYNGPWVLIETHRLPVRFGQIPPGHLRIPPGQAKQKPRRDNNPPPSLRDYDDDDELPGHRKNRNR